MKKFLFIIMASAVALVACTSEPSNNDELLEGETAPFRELVKFNNETILYAKGYTQTSGHLWYHLSFQGHSGEEYRQWYKGMKELDRYMYEQAKEMGVDKNLQGIFYGTLSNISVTANKEVFGRKSGEELVDLFEIVCLPYRFTFPEGELIALNEEGKGKLMNVEEWLKLGFMSEIRLELQLKQGLDRQEILNNADITIKATMNDITVSAVVAAEDIHRYEL
jgi:hypothetical protein